MIVSKELFEIARMAEKEPNARHAVDCVKFETDGLRNEASATDGRSAILVKWDALEETEGDEVYVIPASDCLQIRPGIKRINKQATAKISDNNDGFTLFEEFNKIGSVFRSPNTEGRFPDIKQVVEDRIDSEGDNETFVFSVSRLAQLMSTIAKIIGSNEMVELRIDVDEIGPAIIVQHRGMKIVDAVLLGHSDA